MLTLLVAWLSKRAIEDPVARGLRAALVDLRLRGSGHACPDGADRPAPPLMSMRSAGTPNGSPAPCWPRSPTASAQPRWIRSSTATNPELRLSVVPTPIEARGMAMGPCRDIKPMLGKRVCEFGVATGDADAGVALVGDSHAGMWRVVLDQIAMTHRWQGTHMGHASCPLSRAVRDIPGAVTIELQPLAQARVRLVSQASRGDHGVRRAALRRLRRGQAPRAEPARRPDRGLPTGVGRAPADGHADRRHPGHTEGEARHGGLRAARHGRRPAGRTRLRRPAPRGDRPRPRGGGGGAPRARRGFRPSTSTDFLCDARRCYPVIGGALVYKDTTHLLEPFMRSLTPYFQRDLEPLSSAHDAGRE